jgi:hypothetical protein
MKSGFMRFLRSSQNLHTYLHVRINPFLGGRDTIEQQLNKFSNCEIYFYGKDPVHTCTILMKLSVGTYTTSIFIPLVLKKG